MSCPWAIAIARVARWGFRFVRAIQKFLFDWNGEEERPGQKPRPGFPSRVAAIEEGLASVQESVAEIRHQVRPNGGESLWDGVDSIRRNTPGASGERRSDPRHA